MSINFHWNSATDSFAKLKFIVVSGGVFSDLDDEELFSQVSVDPTTGTLVWPGGLDLDPDVLYGVEDSATGRFFTLLSESR